MRTRPLARPIGAHHFRLLTCVMLAVSVTTFAPAERAR